MSLIEATLQNTVSAWEQLGLPALMERFILRNGKVMKPQEFREPLYPAKACFMNATHYVDLHKYAEYVEGFAIRASLGIAMHHAWAQSRDGRAIDPTWNDSMECEYMGVVIDPKTHRKWMRKTNVYGVIDYGLGVNTEFIFSVDPELKGIVEAIVRSPRLAEAAALNSGEVA